MRTQAQWGGWQYGQEQQPGGRSRERPGEEARSSLCEGKGTAAAQAGSSSHGWARRRDGSHGRGAAGRRMAARAGAAAADRHGGEDGSHGQEQRRRDGSHGQEQVEGQQPRAGAAAVGGRGVAEGGRKPQAGAEERDAARRVGAAAAGGGVAEKGRKPQAGAEEGTAAMGGRSSHGRVRRRED